MDIIIVFATLADIGLFLANEMSFCLISHR